MRIIAGIHKGRKLTPPADDTIRPTGARMREALFNMLMHGAFAGQQVRGARIADICCGTGALGFEALSRGAAHVCFVDHAQASISLTKKNAAQLNALEQCQFVQSDATKLPPAQTPFALVMLDPPYGKALIQNIVISLVKQGWVESGSVICIELPSIEDPPEIDGMQPYTQRKYGKTKLVVWEVV